MVDRYKGYSFRHEDGATWQSVAEGRRKTGRILEENSRVPNDTQASLSPGLDFCIDEIKEQIILELWYRAKMRDRRFINREDIHFPHVEAFDSATSDILEEAGLKSFPLIVVTRGQELGKCVARASGFSGMNLFINGLYNNRPLVLPPLEKEQGKTYTTFNYYNYASKAVVFPGERDRINLGDGAEGERTRGYLMVATKPDGKPVVGEVVLYQEIWEQVEYMKEENPVEVKEASEQDPLLKTPKNRPGTVIVSSEQIRAWDEEDRTPHSHKVENNELAIPPRKHKERLGGQDMVSSFFEDCDALLGSRLKEVYGDEEGAGLEDVGVITEVELGRLRGMKVIARVKEEQVQAPESQAAPLVKGRQRLYPGMISIKTKASRRK